MGGPVPPGIVGPELQVELLRKREKGGESDCLRTFGTPGAPESVQQPRLFRGQFDSDFSGDKVCFTTDDGKSEDILCDPDNAAMHVTKYSDAHCTTYLNAFSIPSGQCHQESSDRSFQWSCYESVKKVAKATVSAPLAHQVHQKVYSSPDCSGDSSDSDFSGDKVCFTTGDGKSEDILCDPDNAAMYVTSTAMRIAPTTSMPFR